MGDVRGLMSLFCVQRKIWGLLREEAKGAGVKWTIVITGLFMRFFVCEILGDRGQVEGSGGRRDNGQVSQELGPVTDVSDIGRVLKRILEGHAEAANTVLYIAGDTITYGQLVDIMERVSGREVLRKVWSLDHLQNQLERNP